MALPNCDRSEPEDDSDIADTTSMITMAEKLLSDLIPHLAQLRDRGKGIPTKAPEAFDGTFSELRSRREQMKAYLHINALFLPTDKIKIQTMGTFLKGNALTS